MTRDDLPRRWVSVRPRCRNCLKDIGICACVVLIGATIASHHPEEAVGQAGARTAAVINTASTSSSIASYSIGLPAPLFINDEITGAEIATQPAAVGRAATARLSVERPNDPTDAEGADT